MAEQGLDQAQVVRFVVDLGRAEVAELVHGGSVRQLPGDEHANPVRRQMTATRIGEEKAGRGGEKNVRQGVRERKDPLPVALAVHDQGPSDGISHDVVARRDLCHFTSSESQFVGQTKHQSNSGFRGGQRGGDRLNAGRSRPWLLRANLRQGIGGVVGGSIRRNAPGPESPTRGPHCTSGLATPSLSSGPIKQLGRTQGPRRSGHTGAGDAAKMGEAKFDGLRRQAHGLHRHAPGFQFGGPRGADLLCHHTTFDRGNRRRKGTGSVGLIHPETHFTDEKAGALRGATYRRVRRHWQFINELVLFEIDHHVGYGVHVYGSEGDVRFVQATSLYHPDTVERSLNHDGSGAEPGLKDPDGKWDLRPHASRIQRVDLSTLATWHAFLEAEDVPVGHSRMVYTVNRSSAEVLDKLAAAPRMSQLGLSFSSGWHEKNDRSKGMFDAEWGVPPSWDSVILQGPHLHVANPFYKQPNPTMLHNQDWTAVDLEALPPDAIPATSYKPRGDQATYDAAYTHWQDSAGGTLVAARDHYRIAWRRMAANTGERTLIAALIPPGAAHVHPVHSFTLVDRPLRDLVLAAGFLSTLCADFAVRSVPKSEILFSTIGRMPFVTDSKLQAEISLRILRLSCVTQAFEPLWNESFDPGFSNDSWTCGQYLFGQELGGVGSRWTPATPLRRAGARRQAQIELDALVAIALGLNADELATIYETQFPVLVGYDRSAHFFDRDGRLVPSSVLGRWRREGGNDSREHQSLTEVHPASGISYSYQTPLHTSNRLMGLRSAYAEFSRRLSSL